jgi:hypothetical protein
MGEIIANAPAASNNARTRLSKEESARFFGPPPLIAGEDQAQYEAMRDQISAAVGPFDFLEEIWVNDVVNLVWETQRLRRLRAALLHAAAPEGVYHLLKRVVGENVERKWAVDWAARKPEAVAAVERTLAGAGLTTDSVRRRLTL